MSQSPEFRRVRGHLLAGAATMLSLFVMAPAASAQHAPVNASGAIVATNAQSSNVLTNASGDGSRAEVVVTGTTDRARVTLTDNIFTAIARGNAADLVVAPADSMALSQVPTSLAAAPTGVDGAATLLIANSQDLTGGSAQANQFGAPFRISLGPVSSSDIALDANRSDVAARGNALAATIDAPRSAGTAGIVSLHNAGASTGTPGEFDGVAARVRSGSLLETGALVSSRVSVSGTSGKADAATNAADNSLNAQIGALATSASGDEPSGPVMTALGAPASGGVDAAFAILNRQQAANVTKARAGYVIDFVLDGGPAIRSSIVGDVRSSAIASDANALSATSRGNLASNTIGLIGNIDATAPETVGSIVNIQSLVAARVVGTTHGGVGIDIAGSLDGATVSARDNMMLADAAGNVATSNRLSFDGAVSVGSGLAVATADEARATFALSNAQDYGTTGVSASPAGPAARIAIAGDLDRSVVGVANNDVAAHATGDSAANAIDVRAATFSGAAALTNVQSGSGAIAATVGTASDPGGMTVTIGGMTTGGTLALAGNNVAGSAAGNIATNAIDLSGALTGSAASASVGPDGLSWAASGTLALVNGQTLGGPDNGNATAAIASTVITRSGVTATGPMSGTTIALTGNSQHSDAVGNAAANSLDTRSAGDAGAALALSSTQFGQVALAATSTAAWVSPGRLDGSAVTVSGNSSVATARINDVDNALDAGGAMPALTAPGSLTTTTLGGASGSGKAVLANQQFATGSAAATASTQIDSPADAVTRSSLLIDGNLAAADSVGNRALNAIDLTGGAGASLANSQANMARIDAAASLTGPGNAPADGLAQSVATVSGNAATALARGNAVDNALTVVGGNGQGPATLSVDRYGASATGDAVIGNSQANYGAVTARAGDMVALNATGIDTSAVAIAGNTMNATAFGNVATNAITVTGAPSTVSLGIANTQVNYGPVTASVTGSGYRGAASGLTNGAIGITGNQISATAIGNQASSAIASPR